VAIVPGALVFVSLKVEPEMRIWYRIYWSAFWMQELRGVTGKKKKPVTGCD
jgi:hypothetical protein